jgi:hypothetical protein
MDDPKKLASALRQVADIVLRVRRDVWTLELALRDSGVLTTAQISSARVSVDEMLRKASDRLSHEDVASVLDMLQKFEGPPQ